MLKIKIFADVISFSLLLTLSTVQANDEALLKQRQELSLEELMNLEVTIAAGNSTKNE